MWILGLTGKVALVTDRRHGIGLRLPSRLRAKVGMSTSTPHAAARRCGDCVIRSHAGTARIRWHCRDFSGSAGAEAGCKTSCGVAGQQCGIFEPSRLRRFPMRTGTPLRDKRDERSAALATLSRRDARTELGPHPFISSESGCNSFGNGALRNDQDPQIAVRADR